MARWCEEEEDGKRKTKVKLVDEVCQQHAAFSSKLVQRARLRLVIEEL